MLGSGPDDGDIIEMSPGRPRRAWVIGGRSRRVLAVAGVCALLVAGAVFAAVRLSSTPPAGDPALAKLITEVTTVPLSGSAPAPATPSTAGAAVGSGGLPQLPPDPFAPALAISSSDPIAISGPRLTADGKPEVLYVATEYCPYCVAQNWALIVALSRFGRFSGLSTSRSPFFEDVPPVDGWTFYGSSYASPYLTFVPVENHSSVLVSPKAPPGAAASYRVLQRLTPAEEAAFAQLDPRRQTPFLDFGGQAELIGAGFSPYALVDLSWSQIAGDLRIPLSQPGITILGAADTLTTELCQLTGDRPADACSP